MANGTYYHDGSGWQPTHSRPPLRRPNGAPSSGGGGADSGENVTYEGLPDKPKINGVELSGNKSLESLGIGQPTAEQIATAVSAYLAAHPEAITDKPDVRAIGKGIITGAYKSISLVGDSVTAGAGGTGYAGPQLMVTTNTGYCYANVFKKYVEGRYGITVTNYGISGAQISHLMNKIDTIVPDGTDLVIYLAGINDRKTEESFANFQQNLGTFLAAVAAKGADLLVMTGTPVAKSSDVGLPHAMWEIDEIVTTAAYGEYKFFSMYRAVNEYLAARGVEIGKFLNDSLHPNDYGYLVTFLILCEQIGLPLDIYGDYSVTSDFWTGGIVTHTVTNNLTHVSTSNSAGSVTDGENYTATLTAADGHTLSNVTVTMGGSDVTGSAYSNGVISISSVTGGIIITAVATADGVTTYTITNSLTNVTTSNSASSAEENTAYTAMLTASGGYRLDTVTITMGGADITATAYAEGVVSIAAVTGNVVITAAAIVDEDITEHDGKEVIKFADIPADLSGLYKYDGFVDTSGRFITANGSTYTHSGYIACQAGTYEIVPYIGFYLSVWDSNFTHVKTYQTSAQGEATELVLDSFAYIILATQPPKITTIAKKA